MRTRFAEVRERVDEAAAAAGRSGADVEILVATKYLGVEGLQVLADAGVRLVGESRAQDLVAKHERYGDTFTWDFIGHLQSRKTKQVLPLVRLIHGVDSMSVVQEVQRLSANTTRVLLEVNIGEEETKSGVAPDRVDAFLEEAATYDRVEFVGLMCMPPLGVSAPSSAPYFARTRELAARLSTAWRGRYTFAGLSMGTSADYDVAVSEGATIVRVGSVLF
ncbi:MAG TPA: YggS family pyridoxal phosphate-dependent enzyme [Thermoleophilia bacterium]|nr:YggS family pyridoxal phosphate-dependent enzyme [Thermoleophilia bacterium]